MNERKTGMVGVLTIVVDVPNVEARHGFARASDQGGSL
jgi:hypothetical protein